MTLIKICIFQIVLIAAAFVIGTESSGVAVPAAAALVAPAQLSYAHAVPQNIPPYASQVNVFSRNLSPYIAAPLAAPLPAPLAAPLAAPLTGPAPYAAAYAPYASFAAPAPYIAGPAPVLPAAAPYAAPYPYAGPYAYASAPLLRSPYGVAPAFVR